MKRMRRITALIIAVVVMLLAVAACSKSGDGTAPITTEPPVVAPENYVYVPRYTAVPSDVRGMQSAKVVGDKIMFFNPAADYSSAELMSINADGTDLTPVKTFEAMFVSGFAPLSDGTAWLSAVDTATTDIVIVKIDTASGEEQSRFVFDKAMGSIAQLFTLPSDKLGAVMMTVDGRQMIIELSGSGGVTELGVLPVGTGNLGMNTTIMGAHADVLLAHNQDELFTFTYGSNEKEKVINWLSHDIDALMIQTVGFIGDDVILINNALKADMSGTVAELLVLEYTPETEVVAKTVLTLGCVNLDYYLRREILAFNKHNADYRIEVVDYLNGEPMTAQALADATMRLNLDIVSGNTPDIIVPNENLPIAGYADRGLLEDLYPFLNAETEINLLPVILQACERDGMLTQVAARFSILTMVGNSDFVGVGAGWTFDEAMRMIENDDETSLFPSSFTRRMFMDYLYYFYLGDFGNVDTGVSRFEDTEFKQLLEYAKSLPENATPSEDELGDVIDGRVLVSQLNIGSFEALMVNNEVYGGKLAFKGFPNATGSSSALYLTVPLAMSAKCEHKDAAWSFMRVILSEEFQSLNHFYFPTNSSVFDDFATEARRAPTAEEGVNYTYNFKGGGQFRDPNPHEWFGSDGEVPPKGVIVWADEMGNPLREMPYSEMTDADYERYMGFVESIERVLSYDSVLSQIVDEEIGAYFADRIDVNETCRLIQVRASLYIAEQG